MKTEKRQIRFKYLFIIIFISLVLLCLGQVIFYARINHQVQNKARIILWWTPFVLNEMETITCGAYKCLLTDDRKYYNHADLGAYLFYGSGVKLHDLPLPKGNLLWAIYHEESPKNLPFLVYKEGQAFFDIISTFDRYSHFPLTLQHLPSIELLTDLKYYVPVQIKNKQSIAPVLYIQSGCETPSQRDLYVQEIMKYIAVDSYGSCLNNKKLPDQFKLNGSYELYEDDFMKFVGQYKFTIAIENSVCADYLTEKLWRPLIVGSVPIYLGSPSVKDWLPNEKSAILIDEYLTMRDLAQYLLTLDTHDRLYNEYLQHKLNEDKAKRITNQLLINSVTKQRSTVNDFQCYICELLHNEEIPEKSSINLYDCPNPQDKFGVDNTWKQHWDMGKCQIKVLNHVLTNGSYSKLTEEAFEKLVLSELIKNNC